MLKKILLLIFIFIIKILPQVNSNQTNATYADTLRGMLTPLRTCYDVTFYDLEIRVDPETKFIKGFNRIKFNVVTDFNKMQIDLFPNMKVEKIVLDNGESLRFTREFGAVFVDIPETLKKNTSREITFYYSGNPTIAKRPPWDGGFIWTKDKNENPWVAVTCEGIGASLWWPNKDHLSDKPDSMLISITVPEGLEDISNGRLRSKTVLNDGWVKYDWFVSSPINNYCITLNIGKFAHLEDFYKSSDGKLLSLNYYVMPENLEKAKKHFKQVKKMLTAFENYFGNYPFYKDGYKLIESPHLGMEHQSAIAYGNDYINGYKGKSSTEVGLTFDYIIIHESAHEWWGNSVTAKDLADLWIHESFANYAEALYVEYYYGREASLKYINAQKVNVKNNKPIIGPFNVNKEGGDIYSKGQLMLNTLRSVINNDSLWFDVLRGIQKTFYHKTVNDLDIINYINKKTNTDYSYFFNQYLRNINIPLLDLIISKKGEEVVLRYKWKADNDDFIMPIKVTTSKNDYEFIYPTTAWQSMELKNIAPDDFKVAENLFYINVKIRKQFIDERSSI